MADTSPLPLTLKKWSQNIPNTSAAILQTSPRVRGGGGGFRVFIYSEWFWIISIVKKVKSELKYLEKSYRILFSQKSVTWTGRFWLSSGRLCRRRTHREGSTQLNGRGSRGGGRQVSRDGDRVRGQGQSLQDRRSVGLPAVLPVETQNLSTEHIKHI